MRTEIKELHQRLKTTSIYVTHDQIEAMTMGDKIVVMRDGYIEQTGSPLELYDRPANLFVAGFIGSPAMNFLPGTLRRGNDAAQVELGDGTRMDAPPLAGGIDGQPVIFGTRPENLALVADRRHRRRGRRRRTHRCRHLRRVSTPWHRDVGGVSRAASVSFPAARSTFNRDLQRAHLFDASSGKRLTA